MIHDDTKRKEQESAEAISGLEIMWPLADLVEFLASQGNSTTDVVIRQTFEYSHQIFDRHSLEFRQRLCHFFHHCLLSLLNDSFDFSSFAWFGVHFSKFS